MTKWWPFKKQAGDNNEALFREAEAVLRQQVEEALGNGVSRQAFIHKIATESQQLEKQSPTPHIKAQLRAFDLLYSELRPRMLGNLSNGKAHEMAGQIDEAIAAYEAAMLDEVPTRFPYEHLRVIYRRQGRYDEALRVCKTAVSNPFLTPKDHAHFQSWVEKFSIQV